MSTADVSTADVSTADVSTADVSTVDASTVELWSVASELLQDVPGVAARAAHLEEAGWDGAVVGDSSRMVADPYVMLTLAAGATSTLRLSTCVTNTRTRIADATAGGIASVQVASGNRAVLGIGRGDSALTLAGLPPTKTAEFERGLRDIRELLHPDPERARGMRWLPADYEPVPMNAFVSGPASVRAAAPHVDRITLCVGARTERIEELRGIAREAGAPEVGVMVQVAPHPDPDVAVELVRGYVATFARFAIMQGRPAPARDAEDAQAYATVAEGYDMARHGAGTLDLPRGFMERFAIFGDPDACVERLLGLAALGVAHIQVIPPGTRDAPEGREESLRLIDHEVLPALRSALGR